MKTLLIALLIITTTGCSMLYQDSPKYIAGNYYNAGGSDCRSYTIRNSDSINCFNADKESTGVRYAMYDSQVQQLHQATQRQKTNTVQCKKYFDISLNAEIKTFEGNICPYGWDEI